VHLPLFFALESSWNIRERTHAHSLKEEVGKFRLGELETGDDSAVLQHCLNDEMKAYLAK